MKKTIKSVLVAFLSLTLIAAAMMPAMAAGRAITIRLGDEKLDVVPVLLQGGRAYAPFEALFSALGASAVYDEAAGTITAVSGDKEIVIEPDDYYISVTEGGETQWIYTGAPAITNTSNGQIFVPVRFTAQVLGYVVGWDDAAHAITLETLDEMIRDSGATYTVMEKYLAFAGDFSSKCHHVDGSFEANINFSSLFGYYDDEQTASSLTLGGTATGLIDPGGEDMSINLKTNLSDFLLDSLEGEMVDEETLAIIEQLDDIDISIIINNEDGMIYIRSPLFSALADVSEDTWISIDTGEALSLSDLDLTSDVTVSSLLSMDALTGEGGFEQYVAALLKTTLYEDTGNETADLLAQLNSVFSDQAMTRDGDDYIVTLTSDDVDDYDDYDDYYDDYYDESYTFELRFSFDGDDFDAITVDLSSTTSYSYWDDYTSESGMALSYSFSSDGQSALSLSGTEDGVTILSFGMSFKYTETAEEPARAPAEGSKVISADDLTTPDETYSLEEAV